MKKEEDSLLQFQRLTKARTTAMLSIGLTQLLLYLENLVQADFDLAKKKKLAFSLSDNLVAFLKRLSKHERLDLCVRTQLLVTRGPNEYPFKEGHEFTAPGYIRSRKLRTWKKKELSISHSGLVLIKKEGSDKRKSLELKNYWCRASKNKEKFAFVLEAYRSVKESKTTIHVGYASVQYFNPAFMLTSLLCQKEWDSFVNILGDGKVLPRPEPGSKKPPPEEELDEYTREKLRQSTELMLKQNQELDLINEQLRRKKREEELRAKEVVIEPAPECAEGQGKVESKKESILESGAKEEEEGEDQFQDMLEEEVDVAAKLVPGFDFDTLGSEAGFTAVEQPSGLRILCHQQNMHEYKVVLTLGCTVEQGCRLIANPFECKLYNKQCEEVLVTNVIRSENCAVIYEKRKSWGRTYRARDFVFLRHVFRRGSTCYVVDKSVEDAAFPQFLTVVRGQIHRIVTGVYEQESGRCRIVMNVLLTNGSLITNDQQRGMTLAYLTELAQLYQHCSKDYAGEGADLFSFDYPRKQPVAKRAKEQEEEREDGVAVVLSHSTKVSDIKLQESVSVHSYAKEEAPQITEFKEEALQHADEQQIPQPVKLDENGMAIMEYGFVSKRFQVEPLPHKEPKYVKVVAGHQVWKGNLQRNPNEGGMLFINAKKMQKQKRVLGFVFQKIGKNLLSGKSILNVSLPVDIFSPFSNLELFAFSLSMTPTLLEPTARTKDPVQRIRRVAIWALSESVLYIQSEKPFNPILGETFQCEINGCPVYLQQVSHHPPVASLLMVGRGYRVWGSLEAKIQIKLMSNSGVGSNDGELTVWFEDGQSYQVSFGGGQISGLVTGDRKLNFTGKVSVYCLESGHLAEIEYNPFVKGYFSYGTAENPVDAIRGQVVEVEPGFLRSYRKNKYASPGKKQVLQRHGKFHGNWNTKIYYEGEQMIDYDRIKPFQVEYEDCPLPSDCRYREDLIYRKLSDYVRAQQEKERLQVLQRGDRQLRKKHSK